MPRVVDKNWDAGHTGTKAALGLCLSHVSLWLDWEEHMPLAYALANLLTSVLLWLYYNILAKLHDGLKHEVSICLQLCQKKSDKNS